MKAIDAKKFAIVQLLFGQVVHGTPGIFSPPNTEPNTDIPARSMQSVNTFLCRVVHIDIDTVYLLGFRNLVVVWVGNAHAILEKLDKEVAFCLRCLGNCALDDLRDKRTDHSFACYVVLLD